jgi:hypothetical protein
MKGRVLTVALALGLAGVWANADQAKSRGSGGGGGGSQGGATSRHPSPSGGGSSSGGSSYGGSRSDGGSRVAPGSSRPLTQAERRHPRAGTGHGYRPYHYYPGYGYWYYPGYYPGYYYGYSPYWNSGLYFGVGGAYWGGGYYGGGYGYSPYHYSDAGAVRLLVDPEDTKVYVDGYYAGEVDDFDGLFQRLHIAPGRHEITLKKDGYRSHRYRVYVGENSTLKLRHDMERGSGPDTMEDLAGEKGLYEERARRDDDDADTDVPDREDDLQRPADRDRGDIAPPPPPDAMPEGRGAPGLLRLVVTPDDASVYVDGRFFGSARQSGEIELAPGPHRVEVVRPGYRTVEREVMIEARGTRTLSVTLDRP